MALTWPSRLAWPLARVFGLTMVCRSKPGVGVVEGVTASLTAAALLGPCQLGRLTRKLSAMSGSIDF
jgi:hypothetical protein